MDVYWSIDKCEGMFDETNEEEKNPKEIPILIASSRELLPILVIRALLFVCAIKSLTE